MRCKNFSLSPYGPYGPYGPIVTLTCFVFQSRRPLEGNEAQVCCFIIQLLLLKTPQFRSRVQDFVKDNSSEHWRQNNWHEKHLAFQRKFPERFGPPESVLESVGMGGTHTSLPTYFGNVCLRFLPVFDIVIHRFTEIPPVTKSLETILEHLGCKMTFLV